MLDQTTTKATEAEALRVIVQRRRDQALWVRSKNRLLLAAMGICRGLVARDHKIPRGKKLGKDLLKEAKLLYEGFGDEFFADDDPQDGTKKRAVSQKVADAKAKRAHRVKAITAKHPHALDALEPFFEAIRSFELRIKDVSGVMAAKLEGVPVWLQWAQHIPGIAEQNFASLLGEICRVDEVEDASAEHGVIRVVHGIASYRNVFRLCKRMCVSVVDGKRQHRRKADLSKMTEQEKIAWIRKYGMDAERRSVLWVLGDSLGKNKWKSEFGRIYLARYKHTLEMHPEWTRKHHNDDAMRYMTKKFLHFLWFAQRDIEEGHKPVLVEITDEDEREQLAAQGDRLKAEATRLYELHRPADAATEEEDSDEAAEDLAA